MIDILCCHLKVTAVHLLSARLQGKFLPDVLPSILPSSVVLQGARAVGNFDKLLHNITDVFMVSSHKDVLCTIDLADADMRRGKDVARHGRALA